VLKQKVVSLSFPPAREILHQRSVKNFISYTPVRFVRVQDYFRSNQPILLKLDVVSWAYQSDELVNFWW